MAPSRSSTTIAEISDQVYRIHTPVDLAAGFSFNQYLILDDEPLLFHTGLRNMFPLVREAVSKVVDPKRLRYIAFSHVEADECGALNEWLATAPQASPVCGHIAAMTSITDLADRPPVALGDGDTLTLGRHTVKWLETPHLPHGWDAGYLMEIHTGTLLCGDLFTQGGKDLPVLTESDILESSESFRQSLDYFSHTPRTAALLDKLAQENPATLACMHGSAWKGDGAALLRALGERFSRPVDGR